MVAVIVRDAVGSTGVSSFVRGPSHRTVLPPASYQWSARFTGFAPTVFAPATFHVSLPVLRRVTETCADAPWTIVVGGVGTVYVAARTPAGAALAGVANRDAVRIAGRRKRTKRTI